MKKVLFLITLIALSFTPVPLNADDYDGFDCSRGDRCGGDPAYKPQIPPKEKKRGWEICNKTKYSPINVSIGYWKSKRWMSKGSYQIIRHKCIKILNNILSSDLYYLAQNDDIILRDSLYESDSPFCVHSDFRRQYKIKRKFPCKTEKYKWVSFDHVKVKNRKYLKTYIYGLVAENKLRKASKSISDKKEDSTKQSISKKYNTTKSYSSLILTANNLGKVLGGTNPGYCRKYAVIAVEQHKRNENVGCRLKETEPQQSKSRWSYNNILQYKWCLTAWVSVSKSEAEYRETMLNNCLTKR